VHSRIYESLMCLTQNRRATPRLAEKFEVSPDNKTITFTVRDGLKWSDGTAFSGDDFAFTVEAVMRSKATVRKSTFQDIVGAREYADGKAESISGIQVNGKTISVQMTQPFCPAVTSIGGFGILPKSVFGKYMDPKDANKNIDERPSCARRPSPSVHTSSKNGCPTTTSRSFGRQLFRGKPYLDEWVIKIYPDANAQTAALKTGEIDLATVEPKDLEDLKALQA